MWHGKSNKDGCSKVAYGVVRDSQADCPAAQERHRPDGHQGADRHQLGCGTAVVNTDVRGRSYSPRGVTPTTRSAWGARQRFSMISYMNNQGKLCGRLAIIHCRSNKRYSMCAFARFWIWIFLPLAYSASANELLLWPSDTTVMRAQPDSRIAALPDGAMGVETGVNYSWPGVRMDFRSGEGDLSPYGRATVSVSNTTGKALTVNLSIKGRNAQKNPGGSISLAPYASGELLANFYDLPWALDAPLPLNGMRGYPILAEKEGAFDLRHAISLHVFLCQNGETGGFAVRRIAVSGERQKVLPAKGFLPFVDKYGQFAHDDWPGKIHDDGELHVARTSEDEWLKAHANSPILDIDRYGGWTGGPQLKATGHFRTEKINGKWWLVDPEGRLFFSHGVDCVDVSEVTGISFREDYFSWLPEKDDPCFGKFWSQVTWSAPHGFYKEASRVPYEVFDFVRANARRKYGQDWLRVCLELTHSRIRSWGLNTIANWSSPKIYGLRMTPYTATFNTEEPSIEGSSGFWGKLRDPFAPTFVENAKRRAAAEAKRTGEDPWCIGWFVDNELSWGADNRDLARAVLMSPATQPAKIAVRGMLERKYGAVDRLDAVWGTHYGSWDSFLSATNVPDERLCGPDMEDLHRAVVAQYFRTVRDAIKSVAPSRLYLGARIDDGHGDVIYEECARYCDVVSVNIYKRLPAQDLPSSAEDKPMIVGEFHFGALDRGMFRTGLVSARDQNERAQCYRNYVNACLDHNRIVGAHWFQWRDQSLTGRFDGENYQIGFLSVADTPYPELVAAARDIGATMYRRRYGGCAD